MISNLILSASEGQKWWLAGGIHPSQVVAAYQPKGAASLDASYINLANPGTYDAQVGSVPKLDSSGWVFDGLAGTGYLLGPGASQAGLLVRYSDAIDENYGVVAGVELEDYSDVCWLRPFTPVSKAFVHVGEDSDSAAYDSPPSYGVIGFSGSSSYFNGSVLKSTHLSMNLTHSYGIGCATRPDLSPRQRRASKVQACCFFTSGATITPSQIAALSAAMAAL